VTHRPIRTLEVTGSPGAIGHAHGLAFAEEIRAYADERVHLVCSGLWSGGPMERGDVLEIAAECLPAHRAFSEPLHEELLALAEAAALTPAEAVVVGGFTDFVDTVRASVGGPHPATVFEDDCTAVIVPDRRASGVGLLGQTWDMHDSATEHVILLRLAPEHAPAALVFTTVGCVGQIGMNSAGVCVGINNLTAADGRTAVTWPTVVRGMLTCESADDALAVLLGADLAGGHNYLIFDSSGTGYNVEAMPSERAVTELGDEALVHTNHTIAPAASAHEAERPEELVANSRRRLETAARLLDTDVVTVPDLMELTREPDAICQRAHDPFRIESSGAAIMRPGTGEFWACWGRPEDNEYQHFSLEGVT
jgi:isopenicillin-N N-acyltransferase-like protein